MITQQNADTAVNVFMFNDYDGPTNIQFDPTVVDIANVTDPIINSISVQTAASAIPERFNGRQTDVASAVSDAIKTQYNTIKKRSDFIPCFSVLDSLAASMAQGIINAFNTLRLNIKPDVDQLLETIREDVQTAVVPGEVISKDGQSIDTNFGTINTDAIYDKFGGAEEVLRAVKDEFKVSPSLGLATLKVLLYGNDFRDEAIPVNDEAAKQIVDMLGCEFHGADQVILESRTKFLGANAINFILSPIKDYVEGRGTVSDCFLSAMQMMTKKDGYDKIASTKFNVLDITQEKLDQKCKRFEKAFLLIAFMILSIDTEFARNQIVGVANNVVPGTAVMVNGKMLNEFTNQGGTLEDLAKYLRIAYFDPNRKLPGNGISIKEVLSNKDIVNRKFAEDTAQFNLRVKLFRESRTAVAIEKALNDFLIGADVTRRPKDMSAETFFKMNAPFVKKAVRKYGNNGDNNLENVLYDFIIDVWYQNTPVATAHKLFGEEAIKQLEIKPELSAQDADLIDITVFASLAAQFLADNFIKVS